MPALEWDWEWIHAEGEIAQKFEDQHLQAKELFIFYAMGATLQLSLSKPDVHFPLIFLFSSAELTIGKEYV